MKRLLVFFTFLCNFNIEYAQASSNFPQLDISTYSEQIFWFLIIFALLYIFIRKYAIPKINIIQNTRERLIKQNIVNNSKNISEISKIKKIIDLQLSNAQIESKKTISKVTQELLQIEDKRINKIKYENDKIKTANYQNNLLIEEEFFKNFQSNIKEVTQIILNKIDVSLPEQSITKEIKKIVNIKVDKHA